MSDSDSNPTHAEHSDKLKVADESQILKRIRVRTYDCQSERGGL